MKEYRLSRNIPISIYPPIMLYNKNDVKTVFISDTVQESYANLYIHIPFCPRKCDFCYFTSFSAGLGLVQKYVDALIKEIEFVSSKTIIKTKKIHSIYFGGGTPTYLNVDCLDQLFKAVKDHFSLTDDVEICMEVRPGNEATLEKLEYLKSVGVNRISIGIQSFNDEILEVNGRNSNVKDGLELIERIRKVGFTNINIDIMSGMLNETKETWEHTINQLLEIEPQNITIYKMQLYENSKLTKYCKENGITPMSDEEELAFTKKFYQAFMDKGYKLMSSTYSFSKDDKSIHKYREYRNRGEELIALGLSSNGYINGHVYQKTYDMDQYLAGMYEPTSAYKMTEADLILRGIILGLKSGCVNRTLFKKQYHVDPYDYFEKEFRELKALDYIIINKEEIRINYEQIFFIDDLLRNFFMPQRIKDIEGMLLKYKNYNIRR